MLESYAFIDGTLLIVTLLFTADAKRAVLVSVLEGSMLVCRRNGCSDSQYKQCLLAKKPAKQEGSRRRSLQDSL